MQAIGQDGVLAAAPDWAGIGVVLCLVGALLLAQATLLQAPRRLVEEHFHGRLPRLGSLREILFQRVQAYLGFGLLIAGFAAELFGRYRVPAEAVRFPLVWLVAILAAVAVLELGAWWLSHWLLRRHVREYFLAHPPEFETDVELARELGALFGVASVADDTVQAYLARVRWTIGLPEVAPDADEARLEALGAPGASSL